MGEVAIEQAGIRIFSAWHESTAEYCV